MKAEPHRHPTPVRATMAEHLGVRTQVAGAARSVQDRRTGPTQHCSSSLQMWVTIRPTNGARRQSHSPVARTFAPWSAHSPRGMHMGSRTAGRAGPEDRPVSQLVGVPCPFPPGEPEPPSRTSVCPAPCAKESGHCTRAEPFVDVREWPMGSARPCCARRGPAPADCYVLARHQLCARAAVWTSMP